MLLLSHCTRQCRISCVKLLIMNFVTKWEFNHIKWAVHEQASLNEYHIYKIKGKYGWKFALQHIGPLLKVLHALTLIRDHGSRSRQCRSKWLCTSHNWEMVPYLRVYARMMEQGYQPSGSNTIALNNIIHYQQHPGQEACVSSSSTSAKNLKVVIKGAKK